VRHIQHWTRQPAFKVVGVIHVQVDNRVNLIEHDACKVEIPLPNRFDREQRVIQAAQPVAYNEQHGQCQRRSEVSIQAVTCKRRAKSSSSFNQQVVACRDLSAGDFYQICQMRLLISLPFRATLPA